MTNDDYLDYIDECRRYHQSLNFEIPPSEWAKIAPEAVKDVSQMLLDRYEKVEQLKSEIKALLVEVKDQDELTQMIREVVLGSTLAREVVKIQEEISWQKRFLANFVESRPEIGDNEIEEANKVPLENIIPDLGLRSGKLIRCCPFHEEGTPSFTVFKNNTYYCFGCQEHGTPITFIMKTQHLRFIDAIKYLLKI